MWGSTRTSSISYYRDRCNQGRGVGRAEGQLVIRAKRVRCTSSQKQHPTHAPSTSKVEFYFPNGDLDLILTPGNLFGYVDCQLGKARHQTAEASSDSDPVTVAAISTASLERMSGQAPILALKLMKVGGRRGVALGDFVQGES